MTARHRPRFRLYMAISLDGFVASRDGSVRWLEPYDAYQVGFGEFLATVGSIVMGRKSYEQMLGFGPWPYADTHTVVMSRIALRPATPDTEVSAEPLETLADRLVRETTDGDIWVFGGGEVARAFLAAGRLDTLELCVVPVLVGDGIALFGSGMSASNLRLTMSRQYSNGLMRLDYDILRGT